MIDRELQQEIRLKNIELEIDELKKKENPW